MKRFTLTVALVVVLGGIAWFNNRAPAEMAAPKPHTEKLTIVDKQGRKHDFEIEIAANPADREVGLMFRTKMEPDYGMLFELENVGIIQFWMKNTLIPLDMVFIGTDGTIKTIHENAVPKSLTPISSNVPVSAVLELNGGRAKALGLEQGDQVLHAFFQTAPK